jgi:hypothetical protein
LKGFGITKVVCAYDAYTTLKDYGLTDVVYVNLLSRVTFVKGLKASFEFLLAT